MNPNDDYAQSPLTIQSYAYNLRETVKEINESKVVPLDLTKLEFSINTKDHIAFDIAFKIGINSIVINENIIDLQKFLYLGKPLQLLKHKTNKCNVVLLYFENALEKEEYE